MRDPVERIADLETAKRRAKALQASELLQNPLFVEAWSSGYDFWVKKFEEERDPVKRDDIWRAMKVFRVIKDQFEKLVKAENDAREINTAAEKQVVKATNGRRRPGQPLDWRI